MCIRDRVNAPLHDIQPEKTLTGAVKGVMVDQVEQLKKMALRSVTDRHKVQAVSYTHLDVYKRQL